jgi:myo-inositol-1-phosphate synthase
LEGQILDYDLVRQVQDEMNKVKVFRGVYDARFIGTSQHATATHVLSKQEAPNDSEALKCLRADIRYFKWRSGVVGHTTVIWSASVEPNSDLLPKLRTANDLLDAIEMTEEQRGGPLPPSLLYAAAALLEGCSFINGGSQNTLSCPGLTELAQQQLGVYCLGTDFKAGQTKAKTAIVEYLRTMGLTPKVIASSNHLGNNDMRNLASNKTAASAKLRVKHDIFAPWEEEDMDHKVSIMFTEYINDEKRDFVEYTSLGFLGQVHTMVTYTRASDSVLCVPLMIDGAVWCDFFSARSWPYEKVAKALAYLFKVPEGSAKGVDPGFFRQTEVLETQVMAAHNAKGGHSEKKRVRIRPGEKATEWAIPHDASIVCAGLACVDMQLNDATGGDGGEAIESFEGEKSIGGGSVSMACKTLARFCHGEPLDEGFMQVTPPVVHSVIPLCKIGNDATGDKLISLLEDCGSACRNVDTKHIKSAREGDTVSRTALSVLPIYQDGRRGCFFDAASNSTFSAKEVLDMLANLSLAASNPQLDMSSMSADDIDNYLADLERMAPACGAFLFGYPHLLPLLQGDQLLQVFVEARRFMVDGGIIALDMNGVPDMMGSPRRFTAADLRKDPVIGSALEEVDILHLNEDEICLLTACELRGTSEDNSLIARAAKLFLQCGVAVVVVTRGRKGSYVACGSAERFQRSRMLPASWINVSAMVRAVDLPSGTVINSNGAGDSFTAGFLVAAMLRHTGMTVPSRAPEKSSKPEVREVPPPTPPSRKEKKKLTPYTLYMRENYVSLKKQLNDDKKAIFTKCHEMWETESEDVKKLYERRAMDENEEAEKASLVEATQNMFLNKAPSRDDGDVAPISDPRKAFMTNRSLDLESAIQFATLVAASHTDVSTRDHTHVNVNDLLDKVMSVATSLEEI